MHNSFRFLGECLSSFSNKQALDGHCVLLVAERRHGALTCQGRFLEIGLQMVRVLWAFDPETAVPGDWA